MTAGAVLQRSLRELRRLELLAAAERDCVAALQAPWPGPAQLLYALGHEAGLDRETLLGRCAALYIGFAAGNLADDLIDGDCDYLTDPGRVGPSVQFTLQHAAHAVAARSTPVAALTRAAAALARAGGAEHGEVTLEGWDLERCRAVADGIAGLQWQANLGVLWADTPLSGGAERLGKALGVCLHVAEDIRTGDPRIERLSPELLAELHRWVAGERARLNRSGSVVLGGISRALAAELGAST